MSKASGQDRSALKWLKDDLNELIRQATQYLDDFVESGQTGSLQQECADLIHKINGTLSMVGLHGAVMLTDEMEQVARILVSDQGGGKREAAEALMIALVQLPDYLERLEKGEPDLPFAIISILNDLRASRDAGLLSESAFFAPHINQMLVEDDTQGEANPELKEIASQLRKHFHRGLLGWYKKIEVEKSLTLIGQVFHRLYKYSGLSCSKRIWEAAQALIIGVQEESIEASISVKLLIGHIDREIKYVIEKGEAATECGFALGLLKNILFYIASADSDNRLIKSLQDRYQLKQAIAAIGMGGSEAGLMDENLLSAVRVAIQEDLTRIKDTIDLYIRGNRSDMTSLLEIQDVFGKVADTFGMIGQSGLQNRIRKLGDFVQEQIGAGHVPNDDELMSMASDLLFVESSLANLSALGEDDDAAADGSLPQGELASHIVAVLNESSSEIHQVKDALAAYFESPENNTILQDVPDRFTRLAGAFRIIDQSVASDIVKALNGYVSSSLLQGEIPPRPQLDLLAEVVTGIEYFMEALLDDSADSAGILQFARESLGQLLPETMAVAQQHDLSSIERLDASESRLLAEEQSAETLATDETAEPLLELPEQSEDLAQPAEETAAEELSLQPESLQESEPSLELELPEETEAEELKETADSGDMSLELPVETAEDEGMSLELPEETAQAGEMSLEPQAETPEADEMSLELPDETPPSEELMLEPQAEIPEADEMSLELPEATSDTGEMTLESLDENQDSSDMALELPDETAAADEMTLELPDEAALPQDADVSGTELEQQEEAEEDFLQLSVEEVEQLAHNHGVSLDSEELQDSQPEATTSEHEFLNLEETGDELSLQPEQDQTTEEPALPEATTTAEEAEPATAEEPEATVPVTETAQNKPPLLDDIDSEILDIFIEEAEEEVAVIQQQYPAWREQPDNHTPLERFRRSFHTLKGSGRLVGAYTIGELAWSVENMLNRLIDGSITSSQPLFDLMDEVIESLPGLIEAQKQGTAVQVDVDAMQSAADRLAAGEMPATAESAESPEETASAGSGEAPDEDVHSISIDERLEADVESLAVSDPEDYGFELPDDLLVESEVEDILSELNEVTRDLDVDSVDELEHISAELDKADEKYREDLVAESATTEGSATGEAEAAEDAEQDIVLDSVLQEIFTSESREHFEEIQQFLQASQQAGHEQFVTDTLSRAVHTLRGSAHMAEVESVAEIAAGLEKLVNGIASHEVTVQPEDIELLKNGHDSMAAIVDCINVSNCQLPDWRQLVERIEARIKQVQNSLNEDQASSDFTYSEELLVDSDFETEMHSREVDESIDMTDVSLPEPEPEPEPVSEAVVDEEPEEDLDEELIEIFLEEAGELQESIDTAMQSWNESPDDLDAVAGLQRTLHTLKGGARLAGVTALGDMSHAMETFLVAIDHEKIQPSPAALQLAQRAADRIANQIDELAGNTRVTVDAELLQLLENINDDASLQALAGADATPAVPTDDSLSLTETALEAISDLQLPESMQPESQAVVEDAGEQAEAEQLEAMSDSSEAVPEQIEEEAFVQAEAEVPEQAEGEKEAAASEVESQLPDETAAEPETVAASEDVQLPASQSVDEEQFSSEPETQDISMLSDELAGLVDDMSSTAEVESDATETSQLTDSRLLIDSQLLTDTELLRESALIETSDLDDSDIFSESQTTEVIHFNLDDSRKADQAAAQEQAQREQVRVNSDLLDKLVNNAGEVSIFRSRLEQQNSTLNFNLMELEQTVERLQNQLRQMEIETEAQILFRYERENTDTLGYQKDFDPLELDRFSTIQELSRSLSETVNDLTSIKDAMDDLVRETDTLLLQQSRVTTDLQDGLLRTRMVPIAQQVNRLQRVVRQTARTLGKKAHLEVAGTVGEMDRRILDNIMGPLEHLMRNAVGHGIENPQDRQAAGKDAEGRITMALEREGTDILMSVADDGKGLDLNSIRERALEMELMTADAALSDDDIMQFILEPGFSTAEEVTQISGRGVGMDVVTSQVKQLGGSLQIDSAAGRGTSFNIRLPYTLAISDAMLVRIAEETYAIPHTSIEGVMRISRDQFVANLSGETVDIEFAGHHYPVRYLGNMLGTAQPDILEQKKWYPVLLVRSGESRMALLVDHLLGNRQVVVKSVGAQLSTVRWISGGTILGDGSVALIIDVNALIRSDLAHRTSVVTETESDETGGVLVMVVDDSITVRKVTSRLLGRHNMEVITAKDGVDALAVLQERMPDVMLLDIEMPRMDGFELARHMKNSAELKNIPIIMITSRTGEKHRNRAMDIGVQGYLGKPYQEEELLENIYIALAGDDE